MIRYGVASRAMPNGLLPRRAVNQQTQRWPASGRFSSGVDNLKPVRSRSRELWPANIPARNGVVGRHRRKLTMLRKFLKRGALLIALAAPLGACMPNDGPNAMQAQFNDLRPCPPGSHSQTSPFGNGYSCIPNS